MTFPARRMFAVAAFLFLTVVYLLSQWRDLARGPHVDEIEHLHVAVLMERGLRVYVDFAEHHPPLFWAMLRPLVSSTEGVAAMETLVTRARLLTGLVTALAIFSAALLVWRASGNVWSVVTFTGVVFAAGGVWRNGLGDIRPDSTALAWWWSGAALVFLARSPAMKGAGIGLVFIATLVKPQWPLSSIVVGIAFLLHARRSLLRASAVAVLVAAAGLGATALLADLRAVWFHVVTTTGKMLDVGFFSAGTTAPPFYGCPPIVRPLSIFLCAVIVALWSAGVPRRRIPQRPALAPWLLLIATASMCEILFIYPFPLVDTRFYAFWVIAAGALLALLPHAAAQMTGIQPLPAIVALVALYLSLGIIDPPRVRPDNYWLSSHWIAERLAPGDTIWNGWTRHPIDAHDASYYWLLEHFRSAALLSGTEAGRRFLPPIRETDLPPCRLDPHVRFIGEPTMLPAAHACFQRLRERGLLTPTPFGDLWMVRR